MSGRTEKKYNWTVDVKCESLDRPEETRSDNSSRYSNIRRARSCHLSRIAADARIRPENISEAPKERYILEHFAGNTHRHTHRDRDTRCFGAKQFPQLLSLSLRDARKRAYIPGIAFNAENKIIFLHTSICSKANPLEARAYRVTDIQCLPRRERERVR